MTDWGRAWLGVVLALSAFPARGERMSGAVVDAEGLAVEGAEVAAYAIDEPGDGGLCPGRWPLLDFECAAPESELRVWLDSGSPAAVPVATTRTKSDGRFSLELASGAVDLVATHSRLGAAVALDARVATEVRVALQPRAPIRLRVFRELYTLLPAEDSVSLWLLARRPRLAWRGVLRNGTIQDASVPAGLDLLAVVDVPNTRLSRAWFKPPEQGRVWLAETTTVRGFVTSNGRGVSGATVWTNASSERVLSGDGGVFVLEGIRPNDTVCASLGVRVAAASPVRGVPVELPLARASSLAVEVRDEKTGTPIRGAQVSGSPRVRFPDARFLELDAGRYIAEGLLQGPVTISASASGYLNSTERTVTVDRATTTARILLRRGVLLQLRVIDADTQSPISGATVFTHDVGGIGRTGADGALSETVAPGPQQLTVWADDHLKVKLDARIPTAKQLLVRMKAAGGIALTLREPDGSAATNGRAHLKLAEGEDLDLQLFSRQEPDALGRLSLRPLPPGEYLVTARSPGFSPSQTVRVVVTQEVIPLTLELAPPLSVRGVMVDEQGAPLGGLTFAIGPVHVVTAADGSFVASGLEAGTHKLRLPSGPSGVVESLVDAPVVTAGDQSARVVIRADLAARARALKK
jgi:hypothetical protein